MNDKKIAAAAVAVLLAVSLAGCAGAAVGQIKAPPAQQAAPTGGGPEDAAAMASFNALVGKNGVKAAELLAALDRSIGLVSRNEATAMVVETEAAQKRDLPQLEDMLARETVQRKLAGLYRAGLDLGKAESVGDAELRGALLAVRDGGYRVETAEGMYYPVIDYSRYLKYRGLVTDDLAAYIDLMAVESARPPAKDNALVIGWDEAVRRALAQEDYLRTYEDSPRAGDVKALYGRYLSFVFYGANNTPLFAYDSQAMNADAQAAYAAAAGGDSRLAASLREYLSLLAKNGYRLNDEADQYRKQAVKDLQD